MYFVRGMKMITNLTEALTAVVQAKKILLQVVETCTVEQLSSIEGIRYWLEVYGIEYVRIEPQPELVHPTSEWWIIGDDVDTLHMENGMIDYLGNNVAGNYAGNSTVFENCTPVLVDGVWYWQEEKGDE
jgi:hypothetical protein